MSEGRLAPVREADRHAALFAGAAGGFIGAATLSLLHYVHVSPTHPAGNGGFFEAFGVFLVAAAVFGFLVGAAEGALAARLARHAAHQFTPLPTFIIQVFIISSSVNVLLVFLSAFATYDGVQLAAAIFLAALVVVATSAVGAALLGWSHSIDWPQIPDHLLPSNRTTQPVAPSAPHAAQYQ